MSDAKEARRTVEAFVACWNDHDWDRAEVLLAEDAFHDGTDHPEPIRGRREIRSQHEGLGKAFPDYRWNIERVFSDESGNVAVEMILTGTQEGPMPGPDGSLIEPTNRRIELPVAMVFQVADGLIKSFVGYGDFLEMYAQLGVISGARPAVARDTGS